MDLTLNERIVRICGNANVPEDLGEKQEDVVLKLHGTIHKISEKPLYDGTFDREFLVKIISLEKIEE
jgi:hypothetical protein